ncbi:uncharacterized protein CANTADRAFT_139814 [Suhomyces tanzawaensis NRRL Y-17324]|uniref:Uncharacterized protein n=1 Tax=Suhomyces tanzawaensis NRRL Y-17324 TaxID=984487 RepID=A0A1E4SRZ6_9ASCO|nr:uncharacterized protein CANTADRAFT_139814 [Suhomyces tanzawaensis NRRL Y-17324]ODV82289.1 hypothetical protein CANTADRAFT_139814 [Suhomyces tanzawaensis NRRL Y-17324]
MQAPPCRHQPTECQAHSVCCWGSAAGVCRWERVGVPVTISQLLGDARVACLPHHHSLPHSYPVFVFQLSWCWYLILQTFLVKTFHNFFKRDILKKNKEKKFQ